MGRRSESKIRIPHLTFEEWSAQLKEEWWRLNRTIHWCLNVKKTCPECGKTFTCRECAFEYWLCNRRTDWKNKEECLCPECYKVKEVHISETRCWTCIHLNKKYGSRRYHCIMKKNIPDVVPSIFSKGCEHYERKEAKSI